MATQGLHKTHIPLQLWFWAAYLMTTGTPALSARALRCAMVNPERTPLPGEVEVDQCQVGAREIGRRDAQWFHGRGHRPGLRPRASRDR